MLRLYPPKSEKGPDESVCATLRRHRNGSPSAGTRIASCVMPPPFFHGTAVKDDWRMILRAVGTRESYSRQPEFFLTAPLMQSCLFQTGSIASALDTAISQPAATCGA